MTPRPPIVARLIVRLLLRGELGEVVRGDLEEEFHDALSAGVPRYTASVRYWRQAVASVAAARRASIDGEGIMTVARSLFRSGLMSDVRYVVRRLRASPGFTAAAVMSLAIGIGANTAVAGAARATLFEMLPVERPGELWFLFWGPRLSSLDGMYMDAGTDPATGQRIISSVTYPAYEQIRAAVSQTASIGAFTYMPRTNVAIGNEPAQSAGCIFADAAFFAALRPPMSLGRFLTAADDAPGAEAAVVISYDFWQRAAGGSPSILNAPVSINGLPVRVIGVTGRGFRGLSPGGFRPTTEVTMPLSLQPRVVPSWTPADGSLFTSVRTQWVRALVRLPPGTPTTVFEERVTAALRSHLVEVGVADAATAASVRAVLRPAGRGINLEEAATRRSVAILGGIVTIVLFIACLNLAGLMLARGVARQHEFSVRSALGASRTQLVRLAFIESAILAIVGASLGLALVVVGRGALESMLVDGLGPMLGRIEIDASLLALTAVVGFVAATLAGLLPAVQWSGRRARLNLAQRPRSAASVRHPFGRVLVAIQIAVTVPLLCGAGLLLRTMHNLTHVDLGFSPASIVTFRVDPPSQGSSGHASPIYGRILDELSQVPGVRSASMVENPLIAGLSSTRTALVHDRPRSIYVNAIGPDLFDMLGVPLLAGRVLGPLDAIGPEKVVLNRTAADRLFGGAALGRHFTIPAPPGFSGDRDVEVVGIVADTKYTSVRAAAPPTMFDYYARRSVQTLTGMTFMARVDGNAAALERPIREAVARASKGVAATAYRTQADQIDRTIGRERVFARLLTLFGAFALALASFGLYGATAYAVARRTAEIGVRMALGARRGQVQWMILRQVAVLAGTGLLVGIPAALFTGRLLESLLFGLTPTDPATVIAAAATMLAVVMIAGAVPARRAARIDPLRAIRTE
jgi:predicted permease